MTEEKVSKREIPSGAEPTRVVIENNISTSNETSKTNKSQSRSSIFPWMNMKKALIILIIYGVIASGLWGWFLGDSLRIPGLNSVIDGLNLEIPKLNNQIEELDKQVDELESEVDRLSNETDRLSNETDRLSIELDRFELLNEELSETVDSLNATVAEFSEENIAFNESNVAFREQILNLNQSLSVAKELNINVSIYAKSLENSVNDLEEINDRYNNSIQESKKQIADFSSKIDDLEYQNERLNNETKKLESETAELKEGTKNLTEQVDNLETILSFLADAPDDLNRTVQNISDYLANQINQNRNELLENLELAYEDKYTNYECNFDARFGSNEWIKDKKIEIGETDYTNDVMPYIEENVLTELCANRTDFELFLAASYNIAYPPYNITADELAVGVDNYATALTLYYFPTDGDGLTTDDWVEAGFKCEGLSNDKLFIFNVTQ